MHGEGGCKDTISLDFCFPTWLQVCVLKPEYSQFGVQGVSRVAQCYCGVSGLVFYPLLFMVC